MEKEVGWAWFGGNKNANKSELRSCFHRTLIFLRLVKNVTLPHAEGEYTQSVT